MYITLNHWHFRLLASSQVWFEVRESLNAYLIQKSWSNTLLFLALQLCWIFRHAHQDTSFDCLWLAFCNALLVSLLNLQPQVILTSGWGKVGAKEREDLLSQLPKEPHLFLINWHHACVTTFTITKIASPFFSEDKKVVLDPWLAWEDVGLWKLANITADIHQPRSSSEGFRIISPE